MRYRFGEFLLDARAYTLTRGGGELALQPKVFDVLRFLIEHRDRVVTKEELLETLWAGEHVNEGAVPWSISHARRALGQERGRKQPIETVHGRGYRFTSPVEQLADTLHPPPPPPDASAAGHPSLQSAASPSTLPFVGRAEVMQQLEAQLARAMRGEGGLCLLVGEAGIGKTRCSEELAARARQRGVSVWSGRTVEGLGAPVLWPWLQVLREAVRERPVLNEPGQALLSRLAALEPPPAPSSEPSAQGSNVTGRFWVLDGVSRFLLDAAAQGPILVLIDDLHWADAGTIELLGFLAPELRRSRMFVLATLRDELGEHERRRIGRLLRAAERIELKHLSLPDVERYISEVAAEGEPALELSRAVHRVAAGNPLFVQETVRTLLAEHADKKLSSIAADAVKPSQLARDVLRARLRPLDATALHVLSLASVLGESFELALLQRLDAAPLEQLLSALELAERGGLVVAEGTGPNRYRFAHALLRAILYDDMPTRDRVAAHRRTAELLAELYRAQPRHSEIAYHYHRSLPAGDYGRVATAACRAAEAAARVQAFEDAVSFYEWALEAQALDPQATPRARADLLMSQGTTQRLAGRDENARRTLSLVIDIARQHDFADLLLAAARLLRPTQAMSSIPDPLVRSALEEVLKIAPPGPDRLRVGALSLIACVPPYAHDMRESGELSMQALTLARELGDQSSLLDALRARLYSLCGPDTIDALLDVAAEMLEHGRNLRAWVPVEAHAARFGALLYRGDVPGADAALRELGREVNALRWPESIWYHDRLRAQRRLIDGDFTGAEAATEELRARSKRMGLSYGPMFMTAQRNLLTFLQEGPEVASRGWPLSAPAMFAAATNLQPSQRAGLVRLTAELGDLDATRRMLDSMAARDFEDVPKDIGYLATLQNLAIAAARVRHLGHAERLYALLAPYPQHNTLNVMMYYDGSASFGLAVLASVLGWEQRAEAHFEDAIAMNARMGMRPQLARVYEAYAQFCKRASEPALQARCPDVVARGSELAESLGMRWLIERMHTL